MRSSITIVGATVALVLAGCGSSSTTTSTVVAPPSAQQQQQQADAQAATAPAGSGNVASIVACTYDAASGNGKVTVHVSGVTGKWIALVYPWIPSVGLGNEEDVYGTGTTGSTTAPGILGDPTITNDTGVTCVLGDVASVTANGGASVVYGSMAPPQSGSGGVPLTSN